MRIKYEEKQAEKMFVQEQKAVEEKLVEFNIKNKEHLKETRENYQRIKQNDNKIIAANQEAKKKEENDRREIEEALVVYEREKQQNEDQLQQKLAEKYNEEKKLKQLSIYENFLFKVMKASEEHEKDEKPKDAIKKMIDRYERLKKKQLDLKKSLQEREVEKVPAGQGRSSSSTT